MSDPALVSVVIPTFRREALVVEAAHSALAQEGVTVEVIVLDDSPEGSAEGAVRTIDDERVRYVRHVPPSGGRPAVVRNEGLALARGAYVHFLDDDDLLLPGALTGAVGALERNPGAGVAIGIVVPFGDDATELAHQRAYFESATRRLRAARSRLGLVAEMLFAHTPLVNSACTIRRDCAAAVGGYSPAVARCEDVDFYLRAIRRCGFVFTDRPTVAYRTGEPSLMHSLEDASVMQASYTEIYRHYRQERGAAEFVSLRAAALARRSGERAGGWRTVRWAAAAAIFALLAAPAAVAVEVFASERAALHPPRQAVGAPLGLATATDVRLVASDGVVLRGWYVPSRNRAAIVLGHGRGTQRGQVLPEARALAASGYGVLLFDWRGHGQSGGSGTTRGVDEQIDLDAAIRFVDARPDVDAWRVGAVGVSMGGTVVALDAEHDPRLRAVALEGAYSSLEDEVRDEHARWGWMGGEIGVRALRREGVALDRVRPIDALCRISPRPLFIIDVGDDDAAQPASVARRMFAAACAPKRLWIARASGRRSFADGVGAEADRRLVAFFDTALAPAQPATRVELRAPHS